MLGVESCETLNEATSIPRANLTESTLGGGEESTSASAAARASGPHWPTRNLVYAVLDKLCISVNFVHGASVLYEVSGGPECQVLHSNI